MAFSALIVVMQTILAVLVFALKVNDRSICATRVACEEGALLSQGSGIPDRVVPADGSGWIKLGGAGVKPTNAKEEG